MKNENVEFKLTVLNVAKITYTITLGIAIGKAAAKFVTSFASKVAENLATKSVEKFIFSEKKEKTDYDAEFDKAVEDMGKEKEEGESNS